MRIFALLSILLLWTGTCMADTPAQMLAADGKVFIYFQPAGSPAIEGIPVSDGSVYSAERGLGWDQDLRSQSRDRGDGCTGVALIDRAITTATFSVALPDGNYLFDVTAWDTGFSTGMTPLIDGEAALGSIRLRSGEKGTMTVPVTSRVGKASITLMGGVRGYPNCMVYEIRITPAKADPERWRLVDDTVQTYLSKIDQQRIERVEKHKSQRMAYAPVILKDTGAARQTFDLCGEWLFMPAENSSAMPSQLKVTDWGWHVLGVPQFWNPTEWWIYTSANGTSHNFIRKEIERCEDFTFDYKTTESGWYRQWINVPTSMRGRRLVLRFDAVASIAEVYWNGQKVGSHVGMFGPFECEVTDKVKFGGLNLLAVSVGSSKADPNFAKDSVGVAVTVNITKDMLNSLPHGWYKNGMAGIWQPVTLEVTGKGRIEDVYFKPSLDGATVVTWYSGIRPMWIEGIRHTLVDAATGAIFAETTAHSGSGLGNYPPLVASFRNLKPKLWSPEHPNLYRLKTQIIWNDTVVDEKITTVGFKTFEARGNRLYLNGKPYYLRGADMPPHGLMPNDKALADKFMKLMHDGNEMATRFHMCPPSKVWMDAADKQGVGTSVGETWPWVLMGSNPIPDTRLMEVWRDEFREVVKANRNHPSLMLWTISNESYFEGGRDPDKERQTEKYRWFSDVIKAAREADPKTPIVLHSGYVRNQGDYDSILKPNNLDDGDVDDKHAYFGWYSTSPFQFDFGKSIEASVSKTRPLISQEASTGYPDNDTGHPVESYIRDHVVPQAWVGRHGTFEERPDMFLETHGQITKEYAEKVRRDRTDLSGWMLFANCCWFRDVYDAQTIAPYPAYWGVQKAHQPVLVSLALHDRHFEAGQTFTGEVVVVNDDPDRPKIDNLTMRWHIFGKGADWGTSGSVAFPDCPYDGKSRQSVEFIVPTKAYTPRAPMTLELQLLQGDEVISRNEYPLICTTNDWYAQGKAAIHTIGLDEGTTKYLNELGYECRDISQATAVLLGRVFVAGPGAVDSDKVKSLLGQGANILMLQPDAETIKAVTDQDWKVIDTSGDFVDVFAPELLSGMDPMDLHWWNASPGGLVRVCAKSYQMPDAPGITKLAQHIQPHGYLRQGREQIARYTSWPVVEMKVGEGRLIISSMLLAEDPLAKRFTANLVDYLMK